MLEQTNLKKAELTQKVLKQKTSEAECQKNLKEEKKYLAEITQKIESLETGFLFLTFLVAHCGVIVLKTPKKYN